MEFYKKFVFLKDFWLKVFDFFVIKYFIYLLILKKSYRRKLKYKFVKKKFGK